MAMRNTKAFLFSLLFLLLNTFAWSQKYTDSLYNAQEQKRLGHYLKYNRAEQVCDYFEDDTLRLKLKGTAQQFYHWNIEILPVQKKYLNGKIKSEGPYRIISAGNKQWKWRIDRHIKYWRNGNIKMVQGYSRYSELIYDTLFYKNGSIKMVSSYFSIFSQ